jgi:hypothetical protein
LVSQNRKLICCFLTGFWGPGVAFLRSADDWLENGGLELPIKLQVCSIWRNGDYGSVSGLVSLKNGQGSPFWTCSGNALSLWAWSQQRSGCTRIATQERRRKQSTGDPQIPPPAQTPLLRPEAPALHSGDSSCTPYPAVLRPVLMDM